MALWRSRAVPRWLAVLFFVGLEIAQQQISSGPVVIVYMLPFAAAMALLAARIWQAAALPSSQPRLEPVGYPCSSIQGPPCRASGGAHTVPTRSSTLCVPSPPTNSRIRLMPCLATLGDHLPAARVTAGAK